MTPEEREYWLNAAKYGLPTDVYDRAAYPFTRRTAIPALGATIGPGREDYTVGGDLTRSPYIGSFATGRADGSYIYPQPLGSVPVTVLPSRSVSPPPLNSPLEEDPITVLRRNTDRARNYPRTFSEMFHPSENPEGDIGRYIQNTPAVFRPKPPKSRPGMNIPQAPMPAAPAKSAAPAPGLLDTEEEQPADSKSWYDDPMRMGLLQAGLGLMSAPRYSTNPNDVTLSSALARGLGGFIQGYGGVKKRLDEAERQKIEDDWKRTQMDKDIEYKDALIQMYGIQGEAQRRTADLNATEKELQKQAVTSQVERILEFEGKLGNTTRRLELKRLASSDNTNQQNQFADLYREATTDRTPMEETLVASGKYTEEEAKKLRFTALETQYNKTLDLQTNPQKPETKPRGSQAERDEDILINATAEQANDPKVQMAFQRLFLQPSDETTQWNPSKQQTERFQTYPTIPDYYVKKFPALAQQQAQLKNQSSVVPPKQPSLAEKQQVARANSLAVYEQEILNNNYDQPIGAFSLEEQMPRRWQSDEYRMAKDAQDRWIENVLRAASGAAIAESEYEAYRQQYFPTPGEGPEAVARKRQMRQVKLEEARLREAEQARRQGALPQVSSDPDDILLQ